MKELATFKCVACRGDAPPLSFIEIAELLPKVPEWKLVEIDGVSRLERVFLFKNFS